MRFQPILVTPLLLSASIAHSEIYTARNSGMGGVGVASSRFDAAAHANPALLAKPSASRRISIVFPSVGGEGSDKYDVIDTIDDMDELFDEFEEVVDVSLPTFDLTRANELKDEIISDLNNIDEKPITGEASAIFSVAVPYEDFAWALERRYSSMVVAQLDYDPNDEAILDAAIIAQDADLLDGINSSANATGVVITETALSMAKAFSFREHSFAIGVSPKVYHIDTYFYSQNANDVDTDDIEAEDYLKDYTNINLDLGLAYFPLRSLTIGLTLRDIMRHDYDTITVNGESDTYEAQLSATAGIAYQNRFFSAAIDGDVLPQKGLKSVEDSQFVRGGIELDAWQWAQLRVGIRMDTKGVRDNAMTAGINVSPFDRVHFGFSGWTGDMWNGDSDTYGLAVDLKILL